jgi:hypothetical protein
VGDKIVILGKENLEKLRGHKAYVNPWPDGELLGAITGLSLKAGEFCLTHWRK